MKHDIILAGVGGQGILSIAAVIGYAALDSGLHLKQAEVHGMSQRGGDVQSHLRIADHQIESDLVPSGSADMIVSVEPLESLRYLRYLSPEGWVITNSTPFANIPTYPEVGGILERINALPRTVVVDADAMAKEAGSARAANMVIAGVASHFLSIEAGAFERAITAVFGDKGDRIVATNLAAIAAGRYAARSRVESLA